MLTVHGAIGVATSPAGQPSKDMHALLTDTYRLYIVHMCTAIYGKIILCRHVASWKPCMECLQIYHQ